MTATTITTSEGSWLCDLEGKQNFPTEFRKNDATEAAPLKLLCEGTLTWFMSLESDKVSKILKSFSSFDFSECSAGSDCPSGGS